MKRVIVYVDGFNLYFGLRDKGWKRFYWLNIQKVARRLLRPGQRLDATKYFTAKVKYPPDKQRRQNTFLEALGTLPDFHIYYGHYLADKIVCRKCGHTYTTHHEKMTDVNIAMELLTDAFQDSFDMALLISADGDLVGPIKKVKQLFPKKRVIVVFPPKRHSNALKNVADVCLHLDRATLAKSVFPDKVVKADGFVLRRPSRWR